MRDDMTLHLDCPAKVNLALSVGSPDPQRGGLHPIASWMVAVDLCDQLTVATAADADSRYDIQFADVKRGQVDWPLEKDLAVRAHRLLEQRAGRTLPIMMSLRKCIPTGAGLGGGSSDAAGVLLAVNKLYALNLAPAQLRDLGLSLGSDVGFAVAALMGDPSAIVTGVGDVITPKKPAGAIHLVLMLPPFGCPTGAVYTAFDRRVTGENVAPDVNRVRRLAEQSPLPADGPFNDLAEPACDVQPRLRELRACISSTVNLPVHITGSGAGLFVVASSAVSALTLAETITATSSLAAIAVNAIESSPAVFP